MRKLDYLRNKAKKARSIGELFSIKLPKEFKDRFDVEDPITYPMTVDGNIVGMYVFHNRFYPNRVFPDNRAIVQNWYRFAVKKKFDIPECVANTAKYHHD
nr:MAG TPA: Ig-like domain protein [Caudoviricetes sp.]